MGEEVEEEGREDEGEEGVYIGTNLEPNKDKE